MQSTLHAADFGNVLDDLAQLPVEQFFALAPHQLEKVRLAMARFCEFHENEPEAREQAFNDLIACQRLFSEVRDLMLDLWQPAGKAH